MLVDVKTVLSRPIVPQLICVLWIFLALEQIIHSVMSHSSLEQSLTRPHRSSPQVEEAHASIHEIWHVPLFGDYVPQHIGEDIKQSMLHLKVVGILFAHKEQMSHVLIQTADGHQRLFRVGDTLPGGAVLKRITSDAVLIRSHGELERLSFSKQSLPFEPPAKPLGALHEDTY